MEVLNALVVRGANECRVPNVQDSLDRLLLISDVEYEQQHNHIACYDVEIYVVDDDHGFSGVGLRKRGDRLDNIARVTRGYAYH